MKNIDKIRSMNGVELSEFLPYVSSCDICVHEYGNCEGKECREGIQKWLEEEYELTTQEVYQEYTDYCYPRGECLNCKYHALDSDGECEFNYLVANFNVINGKITRKEM
ncbi:MAG: hypothetical protein ACRCTZ_08035 [Sarcina sp.]